MKTRTNNLIFIMLSFLITSCVSIPKSTATLTQEVIKEADDMHSLNIALVNQLFEERRERLNTFITNQYTPTLITKYRTLLPDSLNYKEELPNILKSIIPVINRKKDSLQNILNGEQQNIITALNANYTTYSKATTSLQGLVNSAVKLKTAENDAISAIQSLTGSSLDVTKIENTINNLIIKSGDAMNKLITIENAIKQN